MPSAAVTTKGQITIPKEVRDILGIVPGDRVAFRVRGDGCVEMEPETVDLTALFGILKPRVRGVTIEDMDETVRRAGSRS